MKTKKILLLMMALVIILSGCGKGNKGDGEVAAIVDGVEIPQKNFDLYYGIQRDQIVGGYGEEFLDQPMDKLNRSYGEILRENILKSLISNQVILNKAESEELGDIDALVEEQISQEKELSGEEGFKENLDYLGLTEEEYKEIVRDNTVVNEYRNKAMEGYEVTEEEINKYYEENKDKFIEAEARHILVGTEEEANDVLARLEKGEDFADLAKELSLDPGSAANGGDLGSFQKGRMVPEFEEYVFNAAVGEVSEPIQTQYGFHIIEVTNFKDSIEDFKKDVEMSVKSDKFVEEMEALEKKAKTKIIYDVSEEPASIKEKIEEQKNQAPADTNTETDGVTEPEQPDDNKEKDQPEDKKEGKNN